MDPTENSQQSPDREQLSLLMLNSRPFLDLATVNLANVGALAISLSEAEQWLRVASCSLAAIYTSLKIIEMIKSFKK
jgi:hypothetical protein